MQNLLIRYYLTTVAYIFFLQKCHSYRDMQRLNLAKNKLSLIPHDALSGLAYLETLELSDNPINQINEGDFNGNFLIPQVNLVLFSILSGKVSETLTLLTFYFQCLLF